MNISLCRGVIEPSGVHSPYSSDTAIQDSASMLWPSRRRYAQKLGRPLAGVGRSLVGLLAGLFHEVYGSRPGKEERRSVASRLRVHMDRRRGCPLSRHGPVVGPAEIAEMLDVRPSTVYQWRTRRILPEPDMQVSRQDAWWTTTIQGWAAETGRL